MNRLITVCKNPILILDYGAINLKKGDWIWMDWEMFLYIILAWEVIGIIFNLWGIRYLYVIIIIHT